LVEQDRIVFLALERDDFSRIDTPYFFHLTHDLVRKVCNFSRSCSKRTGAAYPRFGNEGMNGETDFMASPGAALVTGAAKGIGLRIAERLVSAGYRVVLHCSVASQTHAEAATASMTAQGGKAHVLPSDLREPATLGTLAAEANAIFGPLTLLVNNAAIFEADDAASFDLDLWEKHFAVNLKAPLILSREFARRLPAGIEGAIINIIDQRVLRPTPQFFTYSLSKSALWSATKTMAQAFAPQGIRVNAVGPGPVSPNHSQGEAGFALEVRGLPLARAIAPDDIADAVLYLAGARNVTGQMIAVDAGQHLAWRTPDVVL
jgi:NAD(P)-dependent dehydrogenase (short-subunit alcohol dehydrogenase family)